MDPGRLGSHSVVVTMIGRTNGAVVGGSHGSGVIVGMDRGRAFVLTARHVAFPELTAAAQPPSEHSVRVFISSRASVEGTVECDDERNDLALVSFSVPSASPLRPAPIGRSPPRVGRSVFTVGSPGATYGLVEPNAVSGSCGVNMECEQCPGCFVLTRPLLHGYSGAGVFDLRGRLVGIVAQIAMLELVPGQPHPFASLAIPIEAARPLLKRCLMRAVVEHRG